MAPSAEQVREIFAPLSQQGKQGEFFERHVADDVDWSIMGHTPMSRRYTSKREFLNATISVLRDRVLTEPLRMRPTNVLVSGQWAVVEMEAVDAVCKNGLTYDMRYNWVCRFDDASKIAEVRAYIDSELLTRAMRENP